MDETLKTKLIGYEVKLHQDDIRKNIGALDALLADDFLEISSSGNTYSKKDVLESLTNEEPYEIDSFDFAAREIQKGTVQILYKTDIAEKKTYRSSIWMLDNGHWKIVFHQGTNLP